MQNKTEVIGVSVPEKIGRFMMSNKRWLALGGSAVTGFVMANCFLFGGIAPFGVAFLSAVGGLNAIGAGLGALLGYLISANMMANIKYMAAIALLLCAKWLFGSKVGERWSTAFSVGTCLLCLGICSGANLLLGEITVYDSIMTGAEILLGFGASYFFARTLQVLPMGWRGAGRADVSCVAVAACMVLMGLTSLTVGGLSMGRILAVLLILVCAGQAREAGGTICGVVAGLSVGLAGGGYGYAMGAYAFGGLAAGMLSQAGKVATAAAFIVVNTASALLTMEFEAVNTVIYEVFIASLLFIAVPGSWTGRLALRQLSGQGRPEGTAQATLQEKLGDISVALTDIGKTTQAVSQRLGKLEEPGRELICDKVAERVCGGCGMKTSCWQIRHTVTVKALNDGIAMLRRDGVISREKMPRHFLQGCCRLDDLVSELNTQFNAHVARESVQRKVNKVRAVLTDQFEGMALMLEEVSGELCATRPLDAAKSDRVKDYFARQNLSPLRVGAVVDQYQRMAVELVVPNYQVTRIAKTRMTLDLCSLLEAEFDLPEVITREKQTTFLFCEKATYTVELGAYQLASGSNRICGDAYDFIRNKSGVAHFILSDGMGSGGSAAVDSAMACGLLTKLVNVGIGYEAALKMVNSALLVKSGDESLATIDVCSLDLFTGKASFYKAGAAPTFLLKGGKAGYVESASLPAGILHGVSFEKSSVTLHEGDIVLMVSDGTVSTGTDWIKSELSGMKGADMQRLCEKIAVTAKMRRTDGHEDDITVLAAALHKGV